MASGSIVFVDTNVLLYALDVRDGAKQRAAQAWLERCWTAAAGRVSTQVLNELYANLRKVAPSMDVDDSRALVRRYRVWQPWQIDDQTVDRAWTVQDRHAVSFWDAMVVAAAQMQSCDVLLTEDLQHDQRIDGLWVVDPFQRAPSEVFL